jgi:hypothetical protein
MKIKKRNTHKRVTSSRITSPETRKNLQTGEPDLLLSYADARFNHCHNVTTKELFLYAAGNNDEGDLPDGLDRLAHHKFVIHLDENDVAVGLDVIPARVYRSGVIPLSQKDVETVKLVWLLNGAVCRIIQRPAGVTATQLINLVAELDKLAHAGTVISETTKIGDHGKVVVAGNGMVEVKLRSAKRSGSAPVYDTSAAD